MKTTTTAHRIAALVEAINAEDIAQGRPEGVEARTAAPDDMNIRLMPSNGVGVDGEILVAYIDNHCPCEAFAVLTLEETETTTLIPDRVGQGLPDYSDEDCVTVDGVTFLVVYLGGVAL